MSYTKEYTKRDYYKAMSITQIIELLLQILLVFIIFHVSCGHYSIHLYMHGWKFSVILFEQSIASS